MGETILELRDIRKRFGDTEVLRGVSISAETAEKQAQFTTLCGQ